MSNEVYENPLISRYASREMATLWGAQRKFSTWRRLWIALAESQAELGLPISEAQLAELRANVDNIDFEQARQYEREKRHDVMAHVATYGDCCPKAAGIIHWGATSCFVTDNTDLLLLRESLQLVAKRLAGVIDSLATFAAQYRDLPCLAYTHLQPAQPTTVGKRATLWTYDLVLDLAEVEHRLEQLKARSIKGTTGTQASFLNLFEGNHEKVRALELRVAEKLGFSETYAVTGQTYPRKIDSQVLEVLGGIAQSAHKTATDLRLLQSAKEMEEPFESGQIGSSAMAYKRNPMRSERICGLARFVMNLVGNAADTLATQWMERTLDDSANRRLSLPQAFLGIDAILLIYQNIASGLVVYPKVIERRLREELPFMATENILMAAVRQGGNRQDLHERIRVHSQAAAAQVKLHGQANDLLQRLSNDPTFKGINFNDLPLEELLDVGRSAEQVDEFIISQVEPIRARYQNQVANQEDLKV